MNPLIHFFPNFQSTYLQLDTFKPPLDNKDFRAALAHAIDRNTVCQQVQGGTFVAGHEMLPPGSPVTRMKTRALRSTDLDKAKASLAASGIDPKSSSSIVLPNATGDDDRCIQFIQQQWQTNLGVEGDLERGHGRHLGPETGRARDANLPRVLRV